MACVRMRVNNHRVDCAAVVAHLQGAKGPVLFFPRQKMTCEAGQGTPPEAGPSAFVGLVGDRGGDVDGDLVNMFGIAHMAAVQTDLP